MHCVRFSFRDTFCLAHQSRMVLCGSLDSVDSHLLCDPNCRVPLVDIEFVCRMLPPPCTCFFTIILRFRSMALLSLARCPCGLVLIFWRYQPTCNCFLKYSGPWRGAMRHYFDHFCWALPTASSGWVWGTVLGLIIGLIWAYSLLHWYTSLLQVGWHWICFLNLLPLTFFLKSSGVPRLRGVSAARLRCPLSIWAGSSRTFLPILSLKRR